MIVYWKYISASGEDNFFIFERDTSKKKERCIYDPNGMVTEEQKNWACYDNDLISKERKEFLSEIIKQISKVEAEALIFLHEV